MIDRARRPGRVPAPSRAEVAIDQRRDVRVDHRRAPALELAVLGQHFATTPTRASPSRAAASAIACSCAGLTYECSRHTAATSCAARLNQSRGRIDVVFGRSASAPRPSASSRSVMPNVRPASTMRPRQRHKDVVELGPGLTADVQHVLEAGASRPAPRARLCARARRWSRRWIRERRRRRRRAPRVSRCRQEWRAIDRREWCGACERPGRRARGGRSQ